MVQQQKSPRSLNHLTSKVLQSQSQSQCTAVEDIEYNMLQTEFQTSVKTTALARYICEHFDSLSISIQSRILNTHDFLMLFIPLIDEPPWTRRRRKQIKYTPYISKDPDSSDAANEVLVWEKYIEQEWTEIKPRDLLNMTQCEAQCWIAVFHLTCSNANCREQYSLNTYRKEQILRLRKFLNEYIMDQLPVLVDVTRYMDELSLMYVPDSNNNGSGNNAMLMEQIDQLRESIFTECKRDWDQVVSNQLESIFSSVTDGTDEDLRLIATIYNEDSIDCCLGDSGIHLESLKFDPSMRTQLERIYICVCENCKNDNETSGAEKNFVEVFTLTPDRQDEGIIVQTPNGPFQRIKLVIEQSGDFTQIFERSNQSLKIQANISYKHVTGVKRLNQALDLAGGKCSDSKVEWVQLGKLEDKLVLQLGFKRDVDNTNKGYLLEQAYMAQPSC